MKAKGERLANVDAMVCVTRTARVWQGSDVLGREPAEWVATEAEERSLLARYDGLIVIQRQRQRCMHFGGRCRATSPVRSGTNVLVMHLVLVPLQGRVGNRKFHGPPAPKERFFCFIPTRRAERKSWLPVPACQRHLTIWSFAGVAGVHIRFLFVSCGLFRLHLNTPRTQCRSVPVLASVADGVDGWAGGQVGILGYTAAREASPSTGGNSCSVCCTISLRRNGSKETTAGRSVKPSQGWLQIHHQHVKDSTKIPYFILQHTD
ncbi:hypothetical protein QBC38DRAFT_263774 [Podospora fimiseda]|uniref:Uncharacterized protein n=1 Tax=Podospora fimiseda TaxID=252190 RepID=A0AAN7BLG7_9PEZI|nr:hypothetical protein QBC38DRAFT_263774 [Podospora fimiseda]